MEKPSGLKNTQERLQITDIETLKKEISNFREELEEVINKQNTLLEKGKSPAGLESFELNDAFYKRFEELEERRGRMIQEIIWRMRELHEIQKKAQK